MSVPRRESAVDQHREPVAGGCRNVRQAVDRSAGNAAPPRPGRGRRPRGPACRGLRRQRHPPAVMIPLTMTGTPAPSAIRLTASQSTWSGPKAAPAGASGSLTVMHTALTPASHRAPDCRARRRSVGQVHLVPERRVGLRRNHVDAAAGAAADHHRRAGGSGAARGLQLALGVEIVLRPPPGRSRSARTCACPNSSLWTGPAPSRPPSASGGRSCARTAPVAAGQTGVDAGRQHRPGCRLELRDVDQLAARRQARAFLAAHGKSRPDGGPTRAPPGWARPMAAIACTSSACTISSARCAPGTPVRPETPARNAAQAYGVGAQRQGLEHVAPAAETAVDQHRNASGDGIDHLRQHLQRRRAVVERPPAVVRDDDAVETDVHAAQGALGP